MAKRGVVSKPFQKGEITALDVLKRGAAGQAVTAGTAKRRARTAAKAPATRGGGKATFGGGRPGVKRVPSQSYKGTQRARR